MRWAAVPTPRPRISGRISAPISRTPGPGRSFFRQLTKPTTASPSAASTARQCGFEPNSRSSLQRRRDGSEDEKPSHSNGSDNSGSVANRSNSTRSDSVNGRRRTGGRSMGESSQSDHGPPVGAAPTSWLPAFGDSRGMEAGPPLRPRRSLAVVAGVLLDHVDQGYPQGRRALVGGRRP